MAWQTDDADVVGQCLTAELSSESNLVGLFKQFVLQVDVAEGASRLVARGGQLVVVLNRSELDGEQVLLGAGATDDKGDVVGRAGSGA